jgi:uncharacterized membrane protein YcaP (DUF421 family)
MEFDRIFLGDFSLELVLEIVLRTAIMYLFTLGLIRVLGKRGMGELSPFELVIIVALGSAVGDPMFYADVPLIHGIIVITVVVSLQRALVELTERHKALERLIESHPVCVVHSGQLLFEAMEHEDLSEAEVFMALREQGIEFLEEVRRAYLEPSGKMSVFKEQSPPRLVRSILPEEINTG